CAILYMAFTAMSRSLDVW
nr:immunoglobulin heavy chain junction region [Macaca mulatta]